jgi:hypothetical protein
MRFRYAVFFPVISLACMAQTAKLGTGAVTGHVYCADTNAPARLASVELKSVEAASSPTTGHISYAVSGPGGEVQTSVDGSFALTGIPPGTYYVLVGAAGYLSSEQARDNKDSAKKQTMPEGDSLRDTPRVQVQADQTANIEIRLERGAAISGTVLYDDGSPAPGAEVMALHKKDDKWVPIERIGPMMGAQQTGRTDDLGHYRISGLRGEDYILEVMLYRTDFIERGQNIGAMRGFVRSSMQIYSGDTARIHDAVPFKIRTGEERTGEDITIPLSKFHTISGVLTAARDGHAIREAFVQIADPDSKETIASASTGADGSFHMDCVPEGTYLLRVAHAADMQEQTIKLGEHESIYEEKPTHRYGPLEQTIKVEGDMSSVVLAVPELQQAAASPAFH